MGCQESKSEQEQFLFELWDSTTICRTIPDDYLKEIKDFVHKIYVEENQGVIKSKDLPNELFERIVKEYINNTAEFDLFENIRKHLFQDNYKSKLGFNIFFVLVFLLDANKKEKLLILEELFNLLAPTYNMKGNIKSNPILFKNIITMYIDLVSFCTLGYYLKLHMNEKSQNSMEKLHKIFKAFRFGNREILMNDLFGSSAFYLDEFLTKNEKKLDHNEIRKFMIELDYGKNGFFLLGNEGDNKVERI